MLVLWSSVANFVLARVGDASWQGGYWKPPSFNVQAAFGIALLSTNRSSHCGEHRLLRAHMRAPFSAYADALSSWTYSASELALAFQDGLDALSGMVLGRYRAAGVWFSPGSPQRMPLL